MNYPSLLAHIRYAGKIISPRGEEVREVTHVQLEVTNNIFEFPGVRNLETILNYWRKEWAWYMTGDRDGKYIEQYAKLWSRIKNPDNSLNSNYGYLVFYNRTEHPSNRLENIDNLPGKCTPIVNTLAPFDWAFQSLKVDKNSRQAVMTYNTGGFNFLGNRDYICFTGDTIVHSPEGNKSISEIHEILKRSGKYPVYSWNSESKDIEIKYAVRSKLTEMKKTVRVLLDDNTFIDCTENHKFLVKRTSYYDKHRFKIVYEWVEAKDLKLNDRLLPIRYTMLGGGAGIVKNTASNFSYSNQKKISREYYEFLYGDIGGLDVHHKNGDPFDNKKSNLEVLSRSEHTSHHQKTDNSVFKIRDREAWKRKQSIATTNRNLYDLEYRNKRGYGNHKVISVVKNNETSNVYNIEVEDNHNYFVGSGVLVKNCTQHQAFFIRNNALNCYVALRSSDAIYGLPYNMLWWSFVQQQLRRELVQFYPELRIGELLVTIYSAHMYKQHYHLVEDMIHVKANNKHALLVGDVVLGHSLETYEKQFDATFQILNF